MACHPTTRESIHLEPWVPMKPTPLNSNNCSFLPALSPQVLAFMGYASDGASVSFNSRPVQPLGDRQLRFYS